MSNHQICSHIILDSAITKPDIHSKPVRDCPAQPHTYVHKHAHTDRQVENIIHPTVHGMGGGCITHTHSFNGPLSRTTRVSRYQKGKTSLDFTATQQPASKHWRQASQRWMHKNAVNSDHQWTIKYARLERLTSRADAAAPDDDIMLSNWTTAT